MNTQETILQLEGLKLKGIAESACKSVARAGLIRCPSRRGGTTVSEQEEN